MDAHPLVREHFGEELERDHPEAWREGNDRLYEYYKAQAPYQPDTLEEMTPLYAAVAHGCRAGRHQEALDEVYWRRIQRGNESFSTFRLGAIGAELAALSGFFDPPWRKVVDGLTEADKSWVLNEAGFDLRALGRLAEAAQLMQAGLESDVAREAWQSASAVAGNLSELHLAMGDLAQARAYAERSVALADRSGDAFLRRAMRTTLADALHQAGRVEEAAALFRQAEAMQAERQPQFPLLYSLQGYQYCDLLLGQGRAEEVLERAEKLLEWRLPSDSLLDIALDHLSLGRAYLLQAQQASEVSQDLGGLEQPARHLNRAVDGLRQAGTQDHLPRGLLARAALHRVRGHYRQARRDLEEALSIASRGGMGLHQADCHLAVARLHLAQGERGPAREHLSQAKAMIDEMGYHRRDGEVAQLEEQLSG